MDAVLKCLDLRGKQAADLALWVAGAMCLLMAAHIAAEVLVRTFFGLPLPGTVAIVSNYYMVAVTFLPLAAVERSAAHISVEVLTERFGLKVQYHLQAMCWAICCALAGLLATATWQEAVSKFKLGTYVMESGYQLILWPAYFFMPVGCGLLCLAYLIRLAGYLSGRPIGGKEQVPLAPTGPSNAI